MQKQMEKTFSEMSNAARRCRPTECLEELTTANYE